MVKYTQNIYEIPSPIKDALENANPYYSDKFYKFESKEKHSPTYFFDDSQVLVIVVHKRYIFRYVLLPTEAYKWSDKENDTTFITQVADICYKKLKVDWMGPSDVGALFMEEPNGAVGIPFGSHVIDLSLAEEVLWENIHSKHRNVIRKAEKIGVVIQHGGEELLNEYMKVDKVTWERSKKQVDYEKHYYELFMEFGDNMHVYLAYCNDELQGGAIFLRNNAMSYYLYGASKNAPVTGAMNLLHWEVLKECKKIGIRRYSFVGCRINEDKDSKYHGIQRFKERFGGELIVGRMFKKIFNPIKYNFFLTAMKIKSGQKPKDTIDQEIHKWQPIDGEEKPC